MNHVYRIVFNRALGQVQVASELAQQRGSGRRTVLRDRSVRLLGLVLALAAGGAMAQVAPGQLPTGGNAVDGSAIIDAEAGKLTVSQALDRALIRWDTFDIGSAASVEFVQSAGQVALNQILDTSASRIDGSLTAGGTVFLINPNGVVFGSGASVNVGGLIASTLVPDDLDDFLEFDGGSYASDAFRWSDTGAGGQVINHGSINTHSGWQVALLGTDVLNAGEITAAGGQVALQAAGRVQVELQPGGLAVVVPVESLNRSGRVENSGTISASSGNIVLRGDFADGLASAVVNNSGSLIAAGISTAPGGTVSLTSSGTDLEVGGVINAGTGSVDIATANADVILQTELGAGTLSINSVGGNVEQTGGRLAVLEESDVAGDGGISLDQSGNTFSGRVSLRGGDATIHSGDALALGTLDVDSLTATSSNALDLGSGTIAGALTATSASGGIGQSGALAVGGTSLLDAGVGAITLDHSDNDFGGGVALYGGAVTIHDAGSLTLSEFEVGTLTASSLDALSLGPGYVNAGFSATSGSGGISQFGSLTVFGPITLASGDGAITLSDPDNTFDGVITLSGGDVVIGDNNILRLGEVNAASLEATALAVQFHGDITTTGDQSYSEGDIYRLISINTPVSLRSGGSVDFNGHLEGRGSLSILADGAVSFNRNVNMRGDLSVDAGSLSVGSTTYVYVDSLSLKVRTGGLTQTGEFSVKEKSTLDFGTDDIMLGHSKNDFGGAVSLTGGNVVINGAGELTLDAVDVGSLRATAGWGLNLGSGSIAGALTATSGTQGIRQSGALAVGGTGTFNAGTHAITLDNAGNDFGGTVSLTGGNVAITSGDTLSLGTLDVGTLLASSQGAMNLGAGTVSGSLVATSASGGIGQSGMLVIGGTSTLAAGTGPITLTSLGNTFTGAVALAGGDVSIHNNGMLVLEAVDAASLRATAGSISLRQDVTTAGDQRYEGAVVLDGDVALTSGGDVTFGAAVDGAHALSVTAQGAVGAAAFGGTVALQSLSVDAGSFGVDGDLVVHEDLSLKVRTGGLTQWGAFLVGGKSFLDAGDGAITLTNAGNSFGGMVTLSGGDIWIRNGGMLALDAVDAASLRATAGSINLRQDVTTAGDQYYEGAVVLDGDIALTSGGDVAFGAAVDGAHALSVTAQGAVEAAAFGETVELQSLSVDAGSFGVARDLVVHEDLSLKVRTGGLTQSGAFLVGGKSFLDAGDGEITLTNSNSFGGVVTLSGGDIRIRNGGMLALDAVDAGSLWATAGSISLRQDIATAGNQYYEGAVVLGSDIALTSGGDVTFGATVDGAHALSITAQDAVTAVGFGGSAALDSLSVDAGSFSVGTGLTVTGDLSLKVRTGGIVQSGAYRVGGESLFDAGTGVITLTNMGNDFAGAVSLTGGNVSIRNGGTLTLGAVDADSLRAMGTDISLRQDITTSGDQLYENALRVDGNVVLASGGDVTFNERVLGAYTLSVVADGHAGFGQVILGGLSVDANGFSSVGGLDLARDLSLKVRTGDIVQTGGYWVGGRSFFDAGTGAITLTHSGNDFGGAVSLKGGEVVISHNDVLSLGTLEVGSLDVRSQGALDLGSGTIAGTLTAISEGGGISQSGALEVGGTSTLDAGTGAITLGNTGNDFRGAVTLTGGDTLIRNSGLLTLGTLSVDSLVAYGRGGLNLGAGRISGALTATSASGGIVQSGALTVGGTSWLDAGTDVITLTNAGNSFGGVVTLSGGDIWIRNSGMLALDAVDAGSLRATAADISLRQDVATAGNQYYEGAVILGSDIALTSGGDVTFGATVDGAHALSVTAQNAVTAVGFGGSAVLDSLSVDAGSFRVGTGLAVNGDLSLKVRTGGIVQSGAYRVGGQSLFDAGTGAIALTNAGNDFGGAVSLKGDDVLIRDGGVLALGAVDAVSLQAAASLIGLQQDISTTGNQQYDGAVVLDGDVALVSGGDVKFGSTVDSQHALAIAADGAVGFGDTVTLGELAVDAGSFGAGSALDVSGDLSLTVQAGGITQSGAFKVGGQSKLDAGTGAIALTDAGNDFGGAVSLTGGDVAIRDGGALALGELDVDTLVADSRDALDLGSGRIAGTLAATSTSGGIGQSGALVVGGASALDAGTDAIALTDAGNDFGGAVSLTGGDVSIRDGGALTLGGLDVDTLLADSLDALGLGSGRIAGTLTATSASGGIGQSGALVVGGASTLDAGTGAITLTDAGNDFGGAVSLTGSDVSIRDGGALTLGDLDVDMLVADSRDALDLGTGAIAGALTATSASGGIGQSGVLVIGGASTLDAGTDAIALANAGNHFRGVVSLTGGDISIRDGGALTLGAVDAVSLRAVASAIGLQQDISTTGNQQYNGAVVLDGDVVLAAGGDVAFGSTLDGAHALAVAADGAVDFGDTVTLRELAVDAGSFGAGAVLDVAGDLSLAVQAGGITQSGAFKIGGQSKLDAGTGEITLTDAGNDFGGAVSLTGGDVSIRDAGALVLGVVDVDTLAADSLAALDLGSGKVAGTLTATSASGGIGQSGALVVGGSSTLDAGAGAIMLTDAGNDFRGAVGLAGGDVALRDSGDLALSHLRIVQDGAAQIVAGGALALPVEAVHAGGGKLVLVAQGGELATRASVSGGDVTLLGSTGVVLNHDIDAGGTLQFESGGDLQQSGGRISAARLAGEVAGDAVLTGANRIGQLGEFSARGIHLVNAGSLAITGAIRARDGQLLLVLTEGDLDIGGHVDAADIRLEVAGGIGQAEHGRLAARTLSGRAGGPVALGNRGPFRQQSDRAHRGLHRPRWLQHDQWRLADAGLAQWQCVHDRCRHRGLPSGGRRRPAPGGQPVALQRARFLGGQRGHRAGRGAGVRHGPGVPGGEYAGRGTCLLLCGTAGRISAARARRSRQRPGTGVGRAGAGCQQSTGHSRRRGIRHPRRPGLPGGRVGDSASG